MKGIFSYQVKRTAIWTAFAFALMACLFSVRSFAQVAGTGTIQGTIADATGAVVPNATVVITNVSTDVKRTAQSDSGGIYVFPNIEIGTYTVTVSSPGFETYVKTGNVLEVGWRCRRKTSRSSRRSTSRM